MDPLKDADVIRAKALWEASEKASWEAERAYVAAVLRVAGSRDAAFSALGWQRRTGFRELARLDLSDRREPAPKPKRTRKASTDK